jgi:diacylglycerol O-acyltransferase
VPGSSSQFIFQESDRVPSHTLKVVILGPRPDGTSISFDTARDFVARRMSRFEPFCWAAVHAPFGVGHPFFVRADVDLSYHLRRATVKQPGTERELSAVISEVTTGSLDLDRPLWRVWYVDGLADGTRVLVFKMHHSLADGGASARLISMLLDEAIPAPPASPDRVSRLTLLRAAIRERLGTVLRLPLLVIASLLTFGKRTAKLAGGAQRTAKAWEAPPMPFNEPLTRRRAFAYAHVDLADVKLVREAFGVSFNAVFIAICSAAARGYARDGGLPLDRPMTASVPISIGDDDHLWGNRLSTWYLSAATNVDDPLERLRTIEENARAARLNHELGDPDLQERWMQHWRLWSIPVVYLGRAMAKTPAPPTFNFICSNVRGPKGGSLDGAPVVDLVSVGPLIDGIGLNFTGWSFGDRLAVAVVLCPDHVPDVWDLLDRVPAAMAELVAVASSPD